MNFYSDEEDSLMLTTLKWEEDGELCFVDMEKVLQALQDVENTNRVAPSVGY